MGFMCGQSRWVWFSCHESVRKKIKFHLENIVSYRGTSHPLMTMLWTRNFIMTEITKRCFNIICHKLIDGHQLYNSVTLLILHTNFTSFVNKILQSTGEAQEVLSLRQGPVRVLRMLKTPLEGSVFSLGSTQSIQTSWAKCSHNLLNYENNVKPGLSLRAVDQGFEVDLLVLW